MPGISIIRPQKCEGSQEVGEGSGEEGMSPSLQRQSALRASCKLGHRPHRSVFDSCVTYLHEAGGPGVIVPSSESLGEGVGF